MTFENPLYIKLIDLTFKPSHNYLFYEVNQIIQTIRILQSRGMLGVDEGFGWGFENSVGLEFSGFFTLIGSLKKVKNSLIRHQLTCIAWEVFHTQSFVGKCI